MLRRFRADLHVHTCLSPCADLAMSPRTIAREAQQRNIGIIAICDHNSAENVPAVMRTAGALGIAVLAGMEVCTREEVHVLAIFGDAEGAFALQSLVYDRLQGKNNPDLFGLQVVANENDEVTGFQDRLLIGAADIPLEQIVVEVHRLGGAAIAAHIDREVSSVISQLGFIPPGLRFDALELSRNAPPEAEHGSFARYADFTFVRNSDAHFLHELGSNASEYLLEGPTFDEMLKALHRSDGRRVLEE